MSIVKEVLQSLYGSDNVKLKSTDKGWDILMKPSFVHVVTLESEYIMKSDVIDILEKIADGLGL